MERAVRYNKGVDSSRARFHTSVQCSQTTCHQPTWALGLTMLLTPLAVAVSVLSPLFAAASLTPQRDVTDTCQPNATAVNYRPDGKPFPIYPPGCACPAVQPPSPCTPETAYVRREWGDLTRDERLDYINAFKCTLAAPSTAPPDIAPGARVRYDDFIATHILKANFVHVDGIFNTWHREFVFLWEQTLRCECGYAAPLPYWNWARWPDLGASPLFDGSDTSMGGDGAYDPGAQPVKYRPGTTDPFPSGTGGGCMATGPFVGLVVPFATRVAGFDPANASMLELSYQPHCLRRSLASEIMTQYGNQWVVDQIVNNTDTIADYQFALDAFSVIPPPSFQWPKDQFGSWIGVHSGAHTALGYESYIPLSTVQEIAFFHHHGMVDLVYTRWQARDPSTRYEALCGGSTTLNLVPSANVTLDFELDWLWLEGNRTIRSVMNTMQGHYCYRYDYQAYP